MKIAIVSTNFPRWEDDFRVPFIIDAAKAIQAKGHTVRIITLHQPGSAEHEWIDGLEVFRARYLPEKYEVLQKDAAGLPAAWKRGLLHKAALLPYFRALCAATAQHAGGFDLIHANWTLSGWAAHLTHRRHHCPYVVTIHGSDVFKTVGNPLLRTPVKSALQNASEIIAVSHALADAAKSLDIPANRITVIPTGIDIKKFPFAGLEDRRKILLYVGSLIPRKGVSTLITAMEQVKQRFPDYQLWIVGEGDLRESLERQAQEADLADRVIFLGPQSQAEVARLMRQAKLFILPSTEEGQGVVLVEAMASGTPCIGSDAGGIPTVITPETGRIFPAGDSGALFEAISVLLLDETAWSSASQKAHLRAKRYYDWDHLAESIIAVYQDVLDSEK